MLVLGRLTVASDDLKDSLVEAEGHGVLGLVQLGDAGSERLARFYQGGGQGLCRPEIVVPRDVVDEHSVWIGEALVEKPLRVSGTGRRPLVLEREQEVKIVLVSEDKAGQLQIVIISCQVLGDGRV